MASPRALETTINVNGPNHLVLAGEVVGWVDWEDVAVGPLV